MKDREEILNEPVPKLIDHSPTSGSRKIRNKHTNLTPKKKKRKK